MCCWPAMFTIMNCRPSKRGTTSYMQCFKGTMYSTCSCHNRNFWKPDLSFRVRTVRLSCSYHAQSRRRRLLCSNQIDWNARPQPGIEVRSAQLFSRLSAVMSKRETWTHCGLRTYQSDWRRKQQWGQRSSKKTAQLMSRLLAKQSKRLYSPFTKFFVIE